MRSVLCMVIGALAAVIGCFLCIAGFRASELSPNEAGQVFGAGNGCCSVTETTQPGCGGPIPPLSYCAFVGLYITWPGTAGGQCISTTQSWCTFGAGPFMCGSYYAPASCPPGNCRFSPLRGGTPALFADGGTALR